MDTTDGILRRIRALGLRRAPSCAPQDALRELLRSRVLHGPNVVTHLEERQGRLRLPRRIARLHDRDENPF